MSVDLLTLALAKKHSSGSTGSNTITDLSEALLLRTISGGFSNDSLTSIGMYAMSYCQSLTGVSMPACETISNGAFRNCQTMTSAVFNAATFVGSLSFADCYDLSTVIIGGDGATIESNAFKNCYSLAILILESSTVCVLENVNAFNDTPMASTSHTGSYGKIFVPANLVSAYKAATNWAAYADRIEAIQTNGG